jgi:uncharacterized protein YkuJ
MRSTFEKLAINSIQFETSNETVYVQSSVYSNNLSYNTELILTHSDLNRIINRLMQLNEDISISEMFTVENSYDGSLLYSLNFSNYPSVFTTIEGMEFLQVPKQIRA